MGDRVLRVSEDVHEKVGLEVQDPYKATWKLSKPTLSLTMNVTAVNIVNVKFWKKTVKVAEQGADRRVPVVREASQTQQKVWCAQLLWSAQLRATTPIKIPLSY